MLHTRGEIEAVSTRFNGCLIFEGAIPLLAAKVVGAASAAIKVSV